MALQKRKQSRTVSTVHRNFMSGSSWDINDPFVRLQVASTSCFFGEPAYYVEGDAPQKRADPVFGTGSRLSDFQRKHLNATLNAIDPQEWRGKTTRQLMESAIDSALNANIERTLQFAVELRNVWNMRATPQVIMVRAALHPNIADTGLIAEYAPRIMTRLDEVMNQIAYFESVQGSLKRIPSRLKRAWAARLSQASEYELAKYKLTSRGVNLFDAIRISHAKGTEWRNVLPKTKRDVQWDKLSDKSRAKALAVMNGIDKAIAGELKLGGDIETWESIRSSGGSWEEAARVMGHMALLRNLRNLTEADALDNRLLEKLKNGVVDGRQLPFRYFSAYRALQDIRANGRVLDTLEECLEISLQNAPHFEGRTMSLSDNSGSAQGATTSSMGTMSVASIGNLMGVITGRLSDDGYVGVFGDNLATFAVRNKASIFDQVQQAEKLGDGIGGSTENGIWLFWAKAIREKEHWDNVFVYSDMQAGHGGLYGVDGNGYRDYIWGGGRSGGNAYIDVPKLVNTYRKQVNPNVNVFLVQIAGHQDTIIPEFYDRTYILGGWSDRILNFAEQLANLRKGQ